MSVGHPQASLPRCPNPGIPGLLPACRTKETAVGLANRRNGPVAVSVAQRIVYWPITPKNVHAANMSSSQSLQ